MEELRDALARAKAGEVEGFAVLVERFQDMAVGYAYSIVGDFHLAQDAAQEAFIEAYSGIDKVYGPEAFPGWLRKIVFKQCDRILRRKAIKTAPLDAADQTVANENVAAAIEASELSEAVHRAVRSLTGNVGSVVTLFYLSDYSLREISEFLEVPISTVKSRLHRDRKMLGQEGVFNMENELRQNRPSAEEVFATVVNRTVAAAAGDEKALMAMLRDDPKLLRPHDDRVRGHGKVTLLHYAATAGMLSLAEFAVGRGADLNARDESHGLTPLGWAVVFPTEQHEIADFLLGRSATLDIWSATALNKKEEVAELVAESPSLVHERLSTSDWQMQPLHLAAWKGHLPVVQELLAHGADPRSSNAVGTPEQRAAEAGHDQIARFLHGYNAA